MFAIFSHSAPSATECLLVGEFNDWAGEGMIKGADGTFALTKTLAPGAYAYGFIVDGTFVHDDDKKEVEGVKNAVVRVPGPSAIKIGQIDTTDVPTADPHVAGKIWANAHVLTVSAG